MLPEMLNRAEVLTNYIMLKSSPSLMFAGDTTMYEARTATNGKLH